jgi:hypothetical protein
VKNGRARTLPRERYHTKSPNAPERVLHGTIQKISAGSACRSLRIASAPEITHITIVSR